MSMNLVFKHPSGSLVDFPFQTPTKLTYAVMDESDNRKKLELIAQQLVDWGWAEDDIFDTVANINHSIKDGYTMVMI